MNGLIRRLLEFSIGSVGAALLNLILIPVTTYYLSPTEYGKTSMFLLAQTFLIYVIYLGFDQAFTREFYEYKDKKRLLENAMFVPLIHSVILILMMCLFAPLLSKLLFSTDIHTNAVYLLAISVVFLIFERFILLTIRMENRGLLFSLYNILIKFSILIFTVIFLLVFKPVFITVVYSTIIGQIAGDLILIICNLKLIDFRQFQLDKSLIKRLAKFGLPVVIGTFIYSLFVVIDKVFLRYFTDFNQLGLYTAAFKIASALLILQISFSNFWIPTAYEWYQQKKPISYYKAVSDVVMLLVSVLFLVLLLSKELILIVLSPAYEDAKYIFPFLCFYPLMMTVSETTNLGIVFSKKSYLNILVSLIALIVAIGMNLWLTPILGAIGTAIATGTAYITYFCARTYFSMRIWEGFSVKRHFIVVGILYAVSLYTIFGADNWVQYVLIAVSLALILVMYRSLIKKGIEMLKKDIRIKRGEKV
ncbi:lipopolysaccharide biosynthesis protein [Carnobacterium divergens]|uniref:lipopolysaccharide biosynthesis protein n=1 Tax=Carnobacterium divergens TaxID=2748 RepID=UPI00289087C8|nr:oligosaccharide flippase family protein [Carnobacterium divergens]MDT2012237.1 oligosaccharide flippase family protein [Carnobacterium divergens]